MPTTALKKVSDYIARARELLQDQNAASYRYPDADLISNLNLGLLEARRIRPELFMGRSDDVPEYTSPNQEVVIDQQYRVSLLYYTVGMTGLRDQEASQDSRATVFLNKFVSQLTSMPS